jgi:hypothetical protein
MARSVAVLVVGLLLTQMAALGVPAAVETTYYFAEGTTRPGFPRDVIAVFNSSPENLNWSAEADFADGSEWLVNSTFYTPPNSVSFLYPESEFGPNKDVSFVLRSDRQFTAARYIRVENTFDSTGPVAGATGIAGIPAAATEWDLAEGSTLAGIQEYITIQNPNDQTADISVTYGLEGQAGTTSFLSVPRHSRATVDVSSPGQAGPRQTGVSARVVSTNGVPVVVERPMYFRRDFPGIAATVDGAHDAAGATPRQDWFFAEGNVLGGWDEFLSLFNPSAAAAMVTVEYLLEGAQPRTKTYTVAAGTRRTIQVFTDAPDPRCRPGRHNGGLSRRVVTRDVNRADRG